VHPVSFAAGLYWRKSKLNGAKCLPAILSVGGGRLRLSSAEELVFDVPCGEAEAHFSFLSTLTLTAAGTGFDLVGKGANLSPKFTSQQLAELERLRAQAASADASGVNATTLGPGAGSVAGLIGVAFDAQRMVANIKPWRTVLPAAGVRVS
jgi:hypothetical protein